MKDIIHKTREILQQRGRVVLMIEHSEDKECITHIRKNFIYVAQPADEETSSVAPEVHIKKSFDSKSKDERFALRVKGFFFVNRNRKLVRVDYCHTLKIHLHWKSQLGSPKKSVTMA